MTAHCNARPRGFTLIELLVVMAILATLLSIAAPRYFGLLERAKEAALRTDLRLLREAIDKYKGDRGQLPDSIQSLVTQRYIQAVPIDPVNDTSSDWTVVPHPDGVTSGVFDVRSGAPGQSLDGSSFMTW